SLASRSTKCVSIPETIHRWSSSRSPTSTPPIAGPTAWSIPSISRLEQPMPLPNPIIDDRSYQQLRDELVNRIPVYTPEWTDFNPSDPGVTLIELFAFLGENLLFRFNQTPETPKLAYLKLLQIPLIPAASATGLANMTTALPAGVLVPLATPVAAGSLGFETL